MATPLPFDPERIRSIVFDADGVLVHGKTPHRGAPEALDHLRSTGRSVFVLTNNSSVARRTYAAGWRKRGFRVSEREIITSSYLTALYFIQSQKTKPAPQFAKRCPHIFIVGGNGIEREFARLGVRATWTRSVTDPRRADFVISGIDRKLSYAKVARAQFAIRDEGALFIATNQDPTFPTETRFMPGAGVSIAAIATAAGKDPDVVVGKPNPLAMRIALTAAECQADEAIMVGDRLDTDIAVAQAADVKAILVLSGTTTRAQLKKLSPSEAPDLVIKDVNALTRIFR